jgi:hypothetical protein
VLIEFKVMIRRKRHKVRSRRGPKALGVTLN